MSYYKLHSNDLFVNTIEAYPDVKFYIQSGSIYISDRAYISGTMAGTPDNTAEIGVPRNYISLYEYNINRGDKGSIYPFVVKDGQHTSFKSITPLEWNTQYNFEGAQITSSYNLSASITRYFLNPSASADVTGSTWSGPNVTSWRLPEYYLRALKNTLNYYTYLSPHYSSSYYITENAEVAGVNMITIPSIFYGSKIKKGSVNLKFYITGTLAAQASDYRYNGELVQVSGTTTGSVVGTILYKEGFIFLTSSVFLDTTVLDYDGITCQSSWVRFGYGANAGIQPNVSSIGRTNASASFALEFQGTNQVQTMTVMAKAPQNQLNHSNNPTYLKNSSNSWSNSLTSSTQYIEGLKYVQNIVSASYEDIEPPMKKETYISKVALYDKNRNVIGFANLATPVRKTADREFIFKLKLDL